MSKFFYVFRLLSLLGGFLLIFILPFLKTEQWKKISEFSPPLWVSNTLIAISLLSLVIIGVVYGLHKKIKIPKTSDWTKKWFKRLCLIAVAVMIWWFWYPLKKLIPSTFKERPGVEQKATTGDNKKGVVEVAKQKEKEEKVSYYLKWEKPRNQRLSYIDFSDGRSDVISFEEKDGGVKFTIRNPSKKNEDMMCSLQVFNGRESCGTWNGKNIYNESETVWKWKGGYIDHQGRKGQIFLTEVFSNNEQKYVGKASLPNRPDKWINLVIYQ